MGVSRLRGCVSPREIGVSGVREAVSLKEDFGEAMHRLQFDHFAAEGFDDPPTARHRAGINHFQIADDGWVGATFEFLHLVVLRLDVLGNCP